MWVCFTKMKEIVCAVFFFLLLAPCNMNRHFLDMLTHMLASDIEQKAAIALKTLKPESISFNLFLSIKLETKAGFLYSFD